jgi:hypothetical protein
VAFTARLKPCPFKASISSAGPRDNRLQTGTFGIAKTGVKCDFSGRIPAFSAKKNGGFCSKCFALSLPHQN